MLIEFNVKPNLYQNLLRDLYEIEIENKIIYNLLDIYVPLSLKKITLYPIIEEFDADFAPILQDGEMDKLEELRYNYPSIDIQFTNNYYDDTAY